MTTEQAIRRLASERDSLEKWREHLIEKDIELLEALVLALSALRDTGLIDAYRRADLGSREEVRRLRRECDDFRRQIAALRSAAGRTLADYRPQHDEDCEIHKCRECGHWRGDPTMHGYGDKCDEWHSLPCTCGLDALLRPPLVCPDGSIPKP